MRKWETPRNTLPAQFGFPSGGSAAIMGEPVSTHPNSSPRVTMREIAFTFVIVILLAGRPAGAEESLDFNRQIRPILTNHCFRCHGPDEETVEAGLRLDSFTSATAELESGNYAIVPGQPARSEMLKRITAADEDERMPPVEAGPRLKPKEIALLERWITSGGSFAKHWSLVPPRDATPPANASDSSWVRNRIDAFVLRRLQEEGLQPSAMADRFALARRAAIDLTGLPPTIEDVDRFVNDSRPDAYERYVDRVMASPAFGERWARVWLDIARYADSAGYAQDPPREIWAYRDWVIKAINDNMPFDQFTVEQLAGDLLPDATESHIIATAFHRNTMTNTEGGTDDEEFRNASVIDRVNTTMQVWMGMTMGCAQCHNHKYDPITQEEYFQFFAVFNQTEDADRGNEAPTLATTSFEQQARKKSLQDEIAAAEAEVARLAAAEIPAAPERSGPLKTRYVRVELPGNGVFLHLAEVQAFVGDENVAVQGTATQVNTGYDGPAAYAIDGNTSGNYADKSVSHTAEGTNNPWWEVDLKSAHSLERIVLWNRTDGNTAGRLTNFRVIALDDQREPLWLQTTGPAPNPNITFVLPKTAADLTNAQRAELATYHRAAGSPQLVAARKKVADLKKQLAGIKGVTTPIMRELAAGRQRKTHIQIRGNFLDKGDEVSPGVPAAFHPLPEDAKADRLGVARWIVDDQNPLASRVVVNRFWEQMFGIGIVETSEDFGLQGESPSHPKLLDDLAMDLIRSGWDIKRLLRQLVTSSTYRQTSFVSPELQERDPHNRLLARGPRFRISAEMIRDQALFVGGLLSRKMYGPSVQPPRPVLGLRAAFGGSTDWKTSGGEDKFRRGLYTSWRRTTPYPSMVTFDAPSREFCTVRRIRTNTPLQALVTLNDVVYVEAAQSLARRMFLSSDEDAERISFGFRACLARYPTSAETTRLLALLEDARASYAQDETAARQLATDPLGPLPEGMEAANLAAWTVVANVLMNLDEFLARR